MILQMSVAEAEKIADRVDFEKGGGLVPTIVQDASNGKVLMQAYMNREALILTLTTGKTHFWSRTRRRLWLKGEESGHYSLVQNLILDCDRDSILIQVQQVGPCCHTGRDSCFHNPIVEMEEVRPDASILNRIYEVILERIRTGDNKSYVKNLVNEGEDAILRKIGEESTEVILAAKDRSGAIVSEVTDLMFHIMILLASKKIDLKELFTEFDSRHREKTSPPEKSSHMYISQ
jgi:phosphoribosyl-ATP pyrophosphohydrolase/phosphoribosyl-AMP cyclohydrolase